MSAAEVAAGDDAIYRVSGRRIMMSSILLDVIAVAYTVLTVAIYFNIIRLNVYQPAMMDPWWTWTPYWRVCARARHGGGCAHCASACAAGGGGQAERLLRNR